MGAVTTTTDTTAISTQTPHSDPQPPLDGDDRKRWRTVYRGRRVSRHVGAVVEVELTPAQKEWLDALAETDGLTLVEAVSRALDLVRARDVGGAVQ